MITGPRVRVIGGGIIGMSIAWKLSQNGAAVDVFDAGRVGNEASWAGAGMLAPGGELSEPSRLSDLAMESLRLYPAFVSELSAESGLAIDYRRCGAFSLAYTESEVETLFSLAAKQNRLGIYSEQFAPQRVPGVRPGALAAQYYPHDAVVNPRDVIRALVIACERRGVTLREFEPVREITEQSEFDVTVLSAGAWSSGLTRKKIPEVMPVRGHLVAFESYEHSLCDVMVRHNHTYLLRRSVLRRSVRRSGDVVIAGASSEHCGFDRAIDGHAAQQLAANAVDLVPALAGCGYAAWNGFRPATADGQPVIERVGNSLWLAYGHYRNGILLAPRTAELIAQEINQASLEMDSPWQAAPQR